VKMALTPTASSWCSTTTCARTHNYEEQEIPVSGSASRTPQSTCRASRPTSVGGLTLSLRARTTSPTTLSSRLPRGRFLDPDNLYHRVFLPVLAKAGIREIRLHDLCHTFGSLLLQNGTLIVCVKEEMGTAPFRSHLRPPGSQCHPVLRRSTHEIPPERAEQVRSNPHLLRNQGKMELPPDLVQVVL